MEATQISIDKMVKEDVICIHTYTHIYTTGYYSAFKKNEIMSFAATWMDLERIRLTEVSQTETNIIWHHLQMKSKKRYKLKFLVIFVFALCFFLNIYLFYWGIVDLQCFRCTLRWFSYRYTHILFLKLFSINRLFKILTVSGTGRDWGAWWVEEIVPPPASCCQVPTWHSWCREQRFSGPRSTWGRSRTQSKEDAGTCVWKPWTTCPENDGLEGSGRSGITHSSAPRHPAFLRGSLSFKHGARSGMETAESVLLGISTEPTSMKRGYRSELRIV